MKLNRFAGGNASRVEVYGLFLAAIVLVGGGIGGAYALTVSLNQNDETTTTVSASPQAENATSTPVPDSPVSTTTDPQQPSGTGTDPGVYVAQSQPPVAPPEFVDTRIQAPYIGPANTFSYLSRNYICGWDYAALGGFGWGYDPAEPCNEEFVAYIGQHCDAGDGVIFPQRCEEYYSHNLPVAY